MKVVALMQVTFKEMIHEKIFYLVLILAGLVLALSFALGALSFSEQQKILADFGFLSIELACVTLSVFFGSYMMAKEVEKQTCLLILARPISRGKFIFAKFAGVSALNFLTIFVISVVLGFLLSVGEHGGQVENLSLVALSIFMKASILAALSFACAQMMRPALALLFSMVIYLLGHWIDDLRFFAEKSKEQALKDLVTMCDWFCPNFYKMNWKSWNYIEKGPSSLEVSWAIVHSLGWILVLVVLMQVLFRRKDIV